MLQIFLTGLIAIFVAQASLAADQKKPQSLEEINADLLQKKKELEPFDPKSVKVDLESLGLDDVEKKPEAPKAQEVKQEELPIMLVPAPEEPKPAPKAETKPAKTEAKKEEVKEEKPVSVAPIAPAPSEGILTKIQNLIKNKDKTVILPPAATTPSQDDSKKPAPQYINAKKKKNLQKRQEAEKKKKWDEQQNKNKLKKLEELRKKYLEEAGEEEGFEEPHFDEDFAGEKKLLPQKKDLNPFRNEELPALPILDRYRTKEDLHIPLILTIKERIALLFSTITVGSVSAFNEAYKDIQNPNVQNETGDTILTYSILMKKYPVIASVLGKGADPNMPNQLGYTPAHIAIELLDFKSFELLANNKADLFYTDGFGRNYLMHAARVGLLPAVDLLVSRGVDVNAMDNEGLTALAIAYRYKKELIARYLLKHGAKPWLEKPYDPHQQSIMLELEDRWKKQ